VGREEERAPGEVAVVVRLEVAEGQEDAFRRELEAVLQRVREEPACISIAGCQDPDHPTRFLLFELWSDRESFAEFESGRDYFRAYIERVEPMWTAERDLTMWTRVA
jgi:quinol monooxygenase YgiN